MLVDTVLFDLGEVYINGMIGIERKIAHKLGVAEEVVWKHLNGEKLTRLFKGETSEADYWEAVIREGGYSAVVEGRATSEFLADSMRRNFTEVQGTADVIRSLAQAGYRIGLISDHVREWIAYCEKHFPLQDLFSIRCYSFESGYTKKQPESFHYALKRSDASPDRTLLIDDKKGNIKIAQSPDVNIRYAHQFVDAASLMTALPEYGILL